ncbi:MAG TPA: hypothetical protein VLT59_08270 [Steroidobacteraceae bacterium]|nr:hypothetical protein [Steroidobacteraceae bacterium]
MAEKSIITLSNGLRVGNFSSPHPFNFVDGSVLPPADPEDVKCGALTATETPQPGIKGTTDIDLKFEMSTSCAALLYSWRTLANEDKVDIVLVPLPVKTALERVGTPLRGSPFRVIRVADRTTKAIFIDKFCI